MSKLLPVDMKPHEVAVTATLVALFLAVILRSWVPFVFVPIVVLCHSMAVAEDKRRKSEKNND